MSSKMVELNLNPDERTLKQFGFIALYALMLSGILGRLIMPPTDFFMRLLLL